MLAGRNYFDAGLSDYDGLWRRRLVLFDFFFTTCTFHHGIKEEKNKRKTNTNNRNKE